MKIISQSLLLGLALVLLSTVAIAAADTQQPNAPAAEQWPLPLEVAVLFEPTPFQSGGRTNLAYEVYLRNFGSDTITVRSIEVLDADARAAPPLTAIAGEQLDSILESVAHTPAVEGAAKTQILPGASAVAFMWVSLDRSARVPTHLRHRVLTADNVAEGPVVGTQNLLRVLTSPVTGMHWLGSDAPSNDPENHHRRGVLVMEGRATIDRRFATDWKQVENGAPFSGDKLDKRAYYAYGKPVRAVADARVVAVKDGFPDNVPGHFEAFHPAVPITLATIFGNRITLDLGHGQFAHYFHLQAGSLQVKAGDRVRRGQLLARIGASGDAREPHLHFEVTTSAKPIVGEGLPYVIDEYQISATGDRPAERRTRGLPLKDEIVDFR
ncbi:MAG TPA: M23 family metallopeptidase [Steroidobacteraceae bacterium]|jgi:murein DD-endopeptidase MepM/ murein hydrolase activator NlpD|nr:M23 family metallopeptidase [Steroidobacteraceae bacterium]